MDVLFQQIRLKLEEMKDYAVKFTSKMFFVQDEGYFFIGRFVYTGTGLWYVLIEKVEAKTDRIIYHDLIELDAFFFRIESGEIPREMVREGLKLFKVYL